MKKIIFDSNQKITTTINNGRSMIPSIFRKLIGIENERDFVVVWNVGRGGDKLEVRIEKKG